MKLPDSTLLEAETREFIDQKLISAGWIIQNKNRINLYESLGVAVRGMDAFRKLKAQQCAVQSRKLPLGCTDTGPADYMLFVDGKAYGIIEVKREGADLGGVAEQSARYSSSHTRFVERWLPEGQPLPFLCEADVQGCTNVAGNRTLGAITYHEIRFRDERDLYPRSRYVFHFPKPETLKTRLEEDKTLRVRLQDLPELNTENLRACQIDAIQGIEYSLKQGKPRAMLQMATGSGKTYTAVTQVYRLAKFAKVKRVLFLVDRGNLASNAKYEFEQFVIPHDGRKFTQHYKSTSSAALVSPTPPRPTSPPISSCIPNSPARSWMTKPTNVKWYAAGGPDIENNGIAMCSLHHKLFDKEPS